MRSVLLQRQARGRRCLVLNDTLWGSQQSVECAVGDDVEHVARVEQRVGAEDQPRVLEHPGVGYGVPWVPRHHLRRRHGLPVDLHEPTGVDELQHAALAPRYAHGWRWWSTPPLPPTTTCLMCVKLSSDGGETGARRAQTYLLLFILRSGQSKNNIWSPDFSSRTLFKEFY